MSRRGGCWEASALESFLASLQNDHIHGKTCLTRDAARADIFDYIEAFTNTRRRSSTLGKISPASSNGLERA
ncbi:MAG: IS3 family transposase [Betaproteobacteria bacterium]|nr:IS3 family transposase [Betaproteobacteria bacterium]